MLKRLLSVICLALLLLALATATTTRAAPRSASFGQIQKPSWLSNGSAMAQRYGVNPGRAQALRLSMMFASRPGAPTGFASLFSNVTTASPSTSCADTRYGFLNQAVVGNIGYPNGIQYKVTATLTNTAYAAYTYTQFAGFPAVYSPTFDYRPRTLSCGLSTQSGELPPYEYPVIWSGQWYSP